MKTGTAICALLLTAGCSRIYVAAPEGQEVYLVNSAETGGAGHSQHVRYVIGLIPSLTYYDMLNETQLFNAKGNTTERLIAKYGVSSASFKTQYTFHDWVGDVLTGWIPVVDFLFTIPHTVSYSGGAR